MINAEPALRLRGKLLWVSILYFAEGFPLGVFYELFPVYFRQQGVELRQIGLISLLGLAWTLKFLWAPAIDALRHHRRWMFAVDALMAAVMVLYALQAELGPWAWIAIGVFTVLSATNDVAIDGYTIELLERRELGLANGFRIGFYRVGMLATGVILIASDWLGWSAAYGLCGLLLVALGTLCLLAPAEQPGPPRVSGSLGREVRALVGNPASMATAAGLLLAVAGLIDTAYRQLVPGTVWAGLTITALAGGTLLRRHGGARWAPPEDSVQAALLGMLSRPGIWPLLLFVLTFKLGDAAMGFMVKPFWVDSGFSASEIGLVSVNIGLALTVAGGLAGGWFADRYGIFRALWMLGLLQALSNLGYWWAASVLAVPPVDGLIPTDHRLLMYGASVVESFTAGLGTGPFLAFLMAIVDRRRSATEYALLSAAFALSRSLAGWQSGFGAEAFGYADYFLLTFALAFPAYLLLPWVKRALDRADRRAAGTEAVD